MKLLRQVLLIFLICLICEGISVLLPFPCPGSVLSMLILLVLFLTKRLKPDDIKETSQFFLGNMTLVFLPPLVSIMNYFDVLKSIAVKFVLVIIISTIVTFFVAGAVVALVIRIQSKFTNKKEVEDNV